MAHKAASAQRCSCARTPLRLKAQAFERSSNPAYHRSRAQPLAFEVQDAWIKLPVKFDDLLIKKLDTESYIVSYVERFDLFSVFVACDHMESRRRFNEHVNAHAESKSTAGNTQLNQLLLQYQNTAI